MGTYLAAALTARYLGVHEGREGEDEADDDDREKAERTDGRWKRRRQ